MTAFYNEIDDFAAAWLRELIASGLEGLRSGFETKGGRIGEVRPAPEASELGRLANADSDRQPTGRLPIRPGRQEQAPAIESGHGQDVRPGPVNGLWSDADWLFCRDGKWRPVEPGTFPLADAGAFRNRVGELRGAGNAINLAQAQAFIEAFIECKI